MPFVRRQRKYYKDGVEVPASSITDFGRTAYYKNIVTTKYWKEITTEVEGDVLAYAAYYKSGDTLSSMRCYAKTPLGENTNVYFGESSVGTGWASSIDDLAVSTYYSPYKSLTETNMVVLSYTLTRQYDQDIYTKGMIPTTETVEGTPEDYTYTTEETETIEVTADDDYDYTEFVPSTQFDYHVDSNKLYQLAAIERTYYKYGTEPNVTVVGSPTIVDGVVSGFNASNCLIVPENLPDTISSSEYVFKILTGSSVSSPENQIMHAHQSPNTWCVAVRGGMLQVFNGSWNSTSTTVLPNTEYFVKSVFNGSSWILYSSADGVVWKEDFVWNNTTSYAGTNLYIGRDYDTTGEYFAGTIDLTQSYIKINGKMWWHGTKVVETTEADADYYTDNIINHSPMTSKTKYYKYAYQDWQQPVLTANGTMGGSSFAVNQSSLLDSSEPNKAWNAFDGIGATTRWHSAQSLPAWISWYNPNPLKISNVEVTNRASSDGAYPNAYQLQYSDDNSTWVTAVSGKGASGNGAIWNIPVEHDTFHKYWRLYITSSSGSNSGYTTVGEIVITAQEQITVETTSSDYDWYERKTKMY